MNKFVLCIFVILAIGMPELPSTLGCNSDLVRPTTPAPVTRRPKTGHHRWSLYNDLYNAGKPPTRSVEAGSNVFELEMEGFSICNTDGTEGLTFNEIIACQVSYTILLYRLYTIILVFGILDPFGGFCNVSLAHSF